MAIMLSTRTSRASLTAYQFMWPLTVSTSSCGAHGYLEADVQLAEGVVEAEDEAVQQAFQELWGS